MRKVPQPNPGNMWSTPTHMGDTWLEGESDRQRRARVRFPDGKLRVVRCGGVPDTFFSIPAGDGYITSNDGEFIFVPYTKASV